jgi:hypothetical protein
MTTELQEHLDPQTHAHDDAEPHGHAPEDPNAAPMHHDIDENFSSFHIAAAAILGLLALVLGSVFGVVLANN